MKRCFRYHGPFIVILLLVAICTARASRLLPNTEQGKVEVITGGLPQVSPSGGGMEEAAAWNLMDLEDCGNGDDGECSNRRMLIDAHLDYIYTQPHKP